MSELGKTTPWPDANDVKKDMAGWSQEFIDAGERVGWRYENEKL